MFKIRNFSKDDFETISSWWNEVDGYSPKLGQLPEDSTFVLERNGDLLACLSVFLTNTEIVYFENFIASPRFVDRKEQIARLADHGFKFAKSRGFKYVAGFTTKEKLADRYLEIGCQKKLNAIIVFKEL